MTEIHQKFWLKTLIMKEIPNLQLSVGTQSLVCQNSFSVPGNPNNNDSFWRVWDYWHFRMDTVTFNSESQFVFDSPGTTVSGGVFDFTSNNTVGCTISQ